MDWLVYIFDVLVIPALSPLLIGCMRKMKARLQNRSGASVIQPYFDLIKLFQKDEVVSRDNSWIFSAAPYIIFGTTLALSLGLPFIVSLSPFAPMGDIFVFVYTLALGTFFLALAGIDSGGNFGGFGASREMMITALSDGGLILSLIAASIIARSTNITTMSAILPHIANHSYLPLTIAGFAFFIALLAENTRYPIDNPATHLELTMVHEAMILEYSGPRLALMEWASSNKLFIFIVILVNIFFPWGLSTTINTTDLLLGFTSFIGKVALVAATITLIESSMAKFRIFRVPDLLFTSFVLSIIAMCIVVL